jgi:hypothetical protein
LWFELQKTLIVGVASTVQGELTVGGYGV